jgi:hypothetical protein
MDEKENNEYMPSSVFNDLLSSLSERKGERSRKEKVREASELVG